MKKLITFSFLLFTSVLLGQGGFTYSYVDPCSQQTKTVFVTGNQNVTVNYLGNIGSFSQTDFQNGNFDNWITQIQNQVNNSPCDELLTNTTTSQNMFITQNLISTLTSVTAVSSMTASSAITNSFSNPSSSNNNQSGGSNGTNASNNQQNSSTNATSSNSQGNTSNSSSSSNGGTEQGGSTPSGSSPSSGGNQEGGTTNQPNNVPQSGGGQTQRDIGSTGQSGSEGSPKPTQSGSGGGGTTNSVSNASESSSGGGKGKSAKANTGSVIGTGDIVAIRVNDDKSNQLRGTMSVTKSNTNNTRSKGFLLNYTTTVNNSNLTLYGAFTNKKTNNVFIVANSSMIDFDRNFFNTTTALETRKFGKTSIMGGLNFTVGGLGGEMFTNLSAVGGGFHPFKVSKNLSGSLLLLGVYSPFTKFYEGKWWDSGLLIVPFTSWDYSISKNFKYNISISGTYELKGNFLQFQVLTGGKILL